MKIAEILLLHPPLDPEEQDEVDSPINGLSDSLRVRNTPEVLGQKHSDRNE